MSKIGTLLSGVSHGITVVKVIRFLWPAGLYLISQYALRTVGLFQKTQPYQLWQVISIGVAGFVAGYYLIVILAYVKRRKPPFVRGEGRRAWEIMDANWILIRGPSTKKVQIDNGPLCRRCSMLLRPQRLCLTDDDSQVKITWYCGQCDKKAEASFRLPEYRVAVYKDCKSNPPAIYRLLLEDVEAIAESKFLHEVTKRSR